VSEARTKQSRSRDALASEFCARVIARSQRVRPEVAGPMTGSATKQSSGAMTASFVVQRNETAALDCFASLAMTTKEKREAERRQTCLVTSASCDAARTRSLFPPPLAGRLGGGTLACRRSTAVLAIGTFAPKAQLQARLPGTRQDVRSGTAAPTGVQRPCALPRALPAPACPSPGNAPPGPVIVPVR
jgi:hypothetical protein